MIYLIKNQRKQKEMKRKKNLDKTKHSKLHVNLITDILFCLFNSDDIAIALYLFLINRSNDTNNYNTVNYLALNLTCRSTASYNRFGNRTILQCC